ncbi:MAG: pyruvate, phosphate dikinase [Planctomycetota bacterium]|nr:pyruvate, phosphate dikinase [Planctomycetota bacterium]
MKLARRQCRWVRFGTDAPSDGPEVLGVKGCALGGLARRGVAVPPFFVITSEACAEYLRGGLKLPGGVMEDVEEGIGWLEKVTGRGSNSLRLSVRNSAAAAIPGLMPCILNIGLNDAMSQLRRTIEAAMQCWNNPFAVSYRRSRKLTHLTGLAVIVQAMVFGNADENSLVGKVSTRDATSGRAKLAGKFLKMAQGTDLREATRHPERIEKLPRVSRTSWQNVRRAAADVERACGDTQEFSFTIERGKLWVLNSRAADRTAAAAVRIAVDLASEGIIDRKTAVTRVEAGSIEKLLHPTLSPTNKNALLALGTAASPGAAVGKIAFSAAEAQDRARRGEPVILVRTETDASDVVGMHACQAILTSSGGLTSHAAVVARGVGKPCVTGAAAIQINPKRRIITVNSRQLGPGDFLSIDGGNGHVYQGQSPVLRPTPTPELLTLLEWADGYRRLSVRANADTPTDARLARRLGAEGIGLCRTEHMFFSPGRIGPMRAMILAADASAREKTLAKLLPYQRRDFVGIFKAMNGLPVTIRLLDPPLHEFLPREEGEQRALAKELGLTFHQIQYRVQQLRESNPMLGHRGCRLAVSYPEILIMQVRAIIEAACMCRKRGIQVMPEIMIPLIMDAREIRYLGRIVRQTTGKVMAEAGVRVDYLLGSMIETPRAALMADEIAADAEFFSFGTNDLTQMTFGFSRDDATSFLPDYVNRHILDRDPFATLDQVGVGMLMQSAVEKGRAVRRGLKCGICGEHGGDPRSIEFCHRIGLEYVSCSPHRLPIARLAAAQAAIGENARRARGG